jgi:hypothetical protein
MPPSTFKTIKCPKCETQISVRIAGAKKAAGTVAATGCGGMVVGVMGESGVEFPGPLSIAVAAWAMGQIMVVIWPAFAKQFGSSGDE